MKAFLGVIFGIVILPLLLLILFSFINWVISVLFQIPFIELQYSKIWITEIVLMFITIICYFGLNPFNIDYEN